jgi:uncharacterized Zn finger protein
MTPPRQRGGWGSAGWHGDGFPPPSKPIKVEGGLTARSTRGGIGEQWWSRRFIEVLESFAMGGRLTRGRAYARQGQVISLEIEPGEVNALVQGSRVTPYKVRVGLAVFTRLVWAKAEVVLAEQAIHSARLLAGEFPPELEPVFAGIGAPLFPGRLGDLELSCSCPDQMVPCKHLAAVFYLLAERFDDDPFLILRWRGRPREELLQRLRELRGDDAEPAAGSELITSSISSETTGNDAVSGLALLPPVLSAALALIDGEDRPPSGDPERTTGMSAGPAATLDFWTAGPTPPLPVHPELPADLLLRVLPAPGALLGGSRLLSTLSPLYEQLAEPTPETHSRPGHGNLGP